MKKRLIEILKNTDPLVFCGSATCDYNCTKCPFGKQENLQQLIDELEQDVKKGSE